MLIMWSIGLVWSTGLCYRFSIFRDGGRRGNSSCGVFSCFNRRNFLAILPIPNIQSAARSSNPKQSNRMPPSPPPPNAAIITNTTRPNPPYMVNIKARMDSRTTATINQLLSPPQAFHFCKNNPPARMPCFSSPIGLVAASSFPARRKLEHFSKVVTSSFTVAGRSISAWTLPGHTAQHSAKKSMVTKRFFMVSF